MSFLSDILSNLKQTDRTQDLPPGLRTTIDTVRKRDNAKRRLLYLVVFLLVSTGAAWSVIYLYSSKVTTPLDTGRPSVAVAPGDGGVEDNAPDETPEEPAARAMTDVLEDREVRPGGGELETAAQGNDEKTAKKPAAKHGTVPQKTAPANKKATSRAVPDKANRVPGLLYSASDCERNHDYQGAIAAYIKVLDIEPENIKVMSKIAALYITMGSPDSALGYATSALALDGRYLPAIINAGIACAMKDDKACAEGHFQEALSQAPNSRQALFNAALLYEKTEDYDKARGYFLRLKALGDERGAEGLERVDSAQGLKDRRGQTNR